MTSKFWYLTGESFKKKTKSKWFLIANIILLVALIAIVNIDKIITYFGGDFDDTKEIIVVDETGYSYGVFENQIKNINTILDMDYKVELTTSEEQIETLKKDIQDTDKIIVVLTQDETEYLKASVITDSFIDTAFYQYLYQALSNTKTTLSLSMSSINMEDFQKVTSAIQVDRVILNEDETSEEEMMTTIMGGVFPTMILPFFILVIFLVQMIGMEINEEKSSRSMEIIISNVSPKTHFFSKVVAGNAFVLLQGFLLILYALIAYLIRNMVGGAGLTGEIGTYINDIVGTLSSTGIMNQLVYIIPLTLILMVLSFITYSLVAGILASMTVSMEDFQQIQTPIMFICLIGYYLAIMSGMFHGSTFIRILSYVPFLSSLLSPALLITNQIHIIDVLISIVILIIFNFGLVKFGLKIYKVGILNYSTEKMWSKILKAAKEK